MNATTPVENPSIKLSFTRMGPYLCYRDFVQSLDFGPYAHFTVAIALRAAEPPAGSHTYARNGLCIVFHDRNNCDRLVLERLCKEPNPIMSRPSTRQTETFSALRRLTSLREFSQFCRRQEFCTPRFRGPEAWDGLIGTVQAARSSAPRLPALG